MNQIQFLFSIRIKSLAISENGGGNEEDIDY